MDLCDKTTNCSAINYNDASQNCILKACTQPIPSPEGQDAGYKGYAQIPGKALIEFILSYLIPEIKWC